MGLFDDLFGKDKKKSQNAQGLFSFMNQEQDNNYSDKELDNYGLNKNEKEEVKKGNQDPWNFEEEDLEDDDYYNEDD